MTTRRVQARAKTVAQLVEHARQLFAQKPKYRSLMLAYAQYWNDQADDEVHAFLVASERDVPVWPHVCGAYADDDTNTIPGEGCWNCDDAVGYLRGAASDIDAWEPYCHEHGSQDQDSGESYLPYAIAVRRGDGGGIDVDVELVGTLLRPAREIVEDNTVQPDAWRDPKARALFAEVCAHPHDDGPRAVLADYLLESRQTAVDRHSASPFGDAARLGKAEACDPRGEYINLALAAHLDAAASERRDQLLAANLRAWLHPLGAVIPAGHAHFERGFLARVDVFATEESAAAVRGAAAWGTVERIRYLPGSVDVLDPAMTALRAIGPIDARDLEKLADREWPIEELQLRSIDTEARLDEVITMLARLHSFPRLRSLVVGAGVHASSVAAASKYSDERVVETLTRTPWWPQLERLTVLFRDAGNATVGFHSPRTAPPHDGRRVPWLAFAKVGETGEPAGWEVALGPDHRVEIAMVGWHPSATQATLADLVRELPASARIELVSTRFREITQHDVDYVREHADREVARRSPAVE